MSRTNGATHQRRSRINTGPCVPLSGAAATETLEAIGLRPRFDLPPVAPEAAARAPVPLNTPPPAAPFPLEVLPKGLRNFVQESAWATNTPPDFTAVPLLVAAGGAVGNSRRLFIKRSFPESAALWSVIVGRPGCCKSAPVDFVQVPFLEKQASYHRLHMKAVKQWEQDDSGERDDKPVMQRCLTEDSTLERLVELMAENPRGLLMVRDEVSALVAGMNQYKAGGRGNDREKMLSIYSGKAVICDRKSQDGVPDLVRYPFLAVAGGTQPDKLLSFRGELYQGRHTDDGWIDRFLFSYPAPLPKQGERWRELSEAAEAEWERVAATLMSFKMSARAGVLSPIPVGLTPEARDEWVRLTDADAEEQNAPDFPSWLVGPWSKMVPGHLARLALIVQLLRWCCGETKVAEVEARALEDAQLLVNYFKAHTKRCYMLMGADPHVGTAMRVLRWLMDRPDVAEFQRSEAWAQLHEGIRSDNPDAAPQDLNRPLALLVEHLYLDVVEPEKRSAGPGRRPTDRFHVSTSWDRKSIQSIQSIT